MSTKAEPAFFVAVILAAVVWLAAVFLAVGCSSASADSPSAFDMECHPVTIDDRIGQRCTNAEAICYLIDNNLSCIRK